MLSSDVSNRSAFSEKATMNASTFMTLALLIASNASCGVPQGHVARLQAIVAELGFARPVFLKMVGL